MGMSKSGIYQDPAKSKPHFSWNPCGCGCTKGCPDCWVPAKVAKRQGCPLCQKMAIHMHPERLDWPAKRKKPAVILVQFTGELFDPERESEDIHTVMRAAMMAPQHTYVFCTQQAARISNFAPAFRYHQNWWGGQTVHDQGEFDSVSRGAYLNTWVSAEPLCGPIDNMHGLAGVRGVVVGCNNQPNRPYDIKWYESIVEQCAAAGVPCFVKQIRSPEGKLLTDPAKFPEHLRVRQLPWENN